MNQVASDTSKPAHHYPKLAYTLTSIMLVMPVILWPAPIFIFNNPMLADVLAPTWLLCTTFLLLSAVCTDSLLYGIHSFKQAIDTTLWIVLFAALSVAAVQSQSGSWLLAILFALHAMRAGYRLFQPDPAHHQWWLWLAWSRDTAVALVLLAWSSVWGGF